MSVLLKEQGFRFASMIYDMRPYTIFISTFFALTQLMVSCQPSGQRTVASLEAEQFQKTLSEVERAQLLDVRTPGEFSGGHLAGSVNVDWRGEDFEGRVSEYRKDEPIFIYCLSGGRSASAASKLSKLGFTKVYELKGGILAWKSADLPVEGEKEGGGLTLEEYTSKVTTDVPVLVDFYAPWCAPCQKMAPMLEQLSSAHAEDFQFLKLNADEHDGLMKELNIHEIPTLLIYRNGEVSWRHVGLVERETLATELGLE